MGTDPLKISQKESAYLAENASLKNQLETLRCALDQQEQRLSGMVRIAANLTQNSDPGEAMMSIIEDISELLDADRTTIYEIRPDESFLRGLAVQGTGRLEVGIPLGKGIAGKVADKNKALNLKDAYKHPDFDPKVDKLTGYRTHSMLCVPMRNPRKQVIGVVQVLNKRSSAYFSIEDESLLAALASQAAITLEALHLQLRLNLSNTELRDLSEQLQIKVKELGLLYRAERELARCEDVSSLALCALTIVSEIYPSRQAGMAIFDDELRGQAFLLDTASLQLRGTLLEPGDGILGRTVSRGEVLELSTANFEQQGVPPRVGGGFELEVDCAVSIPLKHGDEMIGAIALMNYGDGTRLEKRTPVDLLGLFASQVARTSRLILRRESEQQQERLSTIGQMLSGLLHDLKGPMSVISGYSQLMVHMGAVEERTDAAERIKRQVHSFNDMTKEVISFARGDHSLIKQKVSLVHFFNSFEEAARPEYETGNMSLEIELNGIKECWFDARRMLRVFTNISRNARQAMAAGGTFRITGTSTPSGGAEFLLSDNGPGVPEALRGKLFDLFTTDGKSDGSGLGLAIVKRIVEDHDGSIQFESIQGKGTTFRITLPAPNSTDGLTMQSTS